MNDWDDQTKAAWANLQRTVDEQTRRARAKADEEKRRWDALTPAQRQAEDAARSRAAAEEKFQKFAKGFGPFAKQLRLRESWTLADFALILDGRRPDVWLRHGSLLIDDVTRLREIQGTLESCVGTTLQPLPIVPPETVAKYRVGDLLRVARDKQLGEFTLVEKLAANHKTTVVGAAAPDSSISTTIDPVPSPAVSPQTKSAKALETKNADREKQVVIRRKHVLEVARLLKEEGDGDEVGGVIRLAISAEAFRERLVELHPEWKKVEKRTLGRDRSQCTTRIELIVGRPRKQPE